MDTALPGPDTADAADTNLDADDGSVADAPTDADAIADASDGSLADSSVDASDGSLADSGVDAAADTHVDAVSDTVDAAADTLVVPDGCATPGPISASVSCGSGGYSPSYYNAPYVCQPELHFVSVYTAVATSGHTIQPAHVTWNATGRPGAILVLISYEPVAWTVTLGAGATLSKIIVDGFYASTVTAPSGVAIDNRSPSTDCSYPVTSACISWVEATTGGKRASQSSCYVSQSITLE